MQADEEFGNRGLGRAFWRTLPADAKAKKSLVQWGLPSQSLRQSPKPEYGGFRHG